MVVKKAKGARIWDADDNEYLDFMLGFSTMILGNAPDEVETAISGGAAPRHAHTDSATSTSTTFAKLFCDMAPGVEKVTFCNSGTEATMYALPAGACHDRAPAGREIRGRVSRNA